MTADALVQAVAAALHPAHFFIATNHNLRFTGPQPERCTWELFRGHLLDKCQTRQEREFTSWHVFLDDAEEPILSVKFAEAEQCFYVVRALKVIGQEAFEADGVIDSRPAEKWLRELVGTVELALVRDEEDLQSLLQHCLFLAVVGTSRLPITSLESPLPAFSLGQMGYGLSQRAAGFIPADAARSLEFLLRSTPAGERAKLCDMHALHDLPELSKTIFNQVALSPYTQFVDNWLYLLRALAAPDWLGPAAILDTLGYMLRHLVRHLTAFDLRTFHNRGANYPDALFLDLALQAFLGLTSRAPELVRTALLRRALRMGWLARKELEGLPVPDQPTSPGENLRVLPPPHTIVPEPQLVEPGKRTQKLFDGRPSENLLDERGREVLRACLAELDDTRELRELGMAVFLDRPCGVLKRPGAVDRTSLWSYEAFSPAIARRRLASLTAWGLLPSAVHDQLTRQLESLNVCGLPAAELSGRQRPGVVALEDALQTSLDYLILRTTRSSLNRFWGAYDCRPLMKKCFMGWVDRPWRDDIRLLIRSPRARLEQSPRPFLTGYDSRLRPRLELGLVETADDWYRELAGLEFLRHGLRVLRGWDDQGRELRLAGGGVILQPTFRMEETV